MQTIKSKYKIIYDDADPKKWCVELLPPCAPFHGIILSYGKFSIKKDGEDELSPKISFETDIIYVPERLRGVEFPDSEEDKMQTLLAQILFDIIDNNLSHAKQEDGKLYLELAKDER